jgi:glycyl-tRNA synthetase
LWQRIQKFWNTEQKRSNSFQTGKILENEDLADVKALIEELEIADPDTGSKNWTEVRQFNLMFGTKLGLLQILQWIFI